MRTSGLSVRRTRGERAVRSPVTFADNMKYELTKHEKRMISREHSYRNERAGAGVFALLTGLPLLFYAIVIAYYRLRFPETPNHVPIHWEVFRNSGLPSLLFFFFAYRAQTKLWMIEHLKHHITEEIRSSEPPASPRTRSPEWPREP